MTHQFKEREHFQDFSALFGITIKSDMKMPVKCKSSLTRIFVFDKLCNRNEDTHLNFHE